MMYKDDTFKKGICSSSGQEGLFTKAFADSGTVRGGLALQGAISGQHRLHRGLHVLALFRRQVLRHNVLRVQKGGYLKLH